MLPSKEQKLMNNTSFKQLVTSAMSSCIKSELDRLTVPVQTAAPVNLAEKKLLDWLREKMRTGSILNHQTNGLLANDIHVSALLAMFDDTSEDDITTNEDAQGAIIIDWDLSKSVIVNKIMSSGYLYGLASVINEDFSRNPDGSEIV
ncbi:hypothetical protein [Tenacibaculum sp.]|uniref:hypothetical protein n=1 Tax=Tenacibaculum sp. TaxID=1906242 RepID=UPI003D0CB620